MRWRWTTDGVTRVQTLGGVFHVFLKGLFSVQSTQEQNEVLINCEGDLAEWGGGGA